ncbi:MAG: hypothetical protein CM1200mP22_23310 [Dehalococcoidia bacterium]|nr:MAG: hypothetical protein CM1200mP22_23310 [Dehalococcoidia bacterium]
MHAANVTYFVRDIEKFVNKLEAAARRRVIITIWSIANPMQNFPRYTRWSMVKNKPWCQATHSYCQCLGDGYFARCAFPPPDNYF